MTSKAESHSRKDRERTRHREEILDAALRLLIRKGYRNITMREIASEAEFATGTLYNFFENKETLYTELIRTFARQIGQFFLPILDEGRDEREKLSHYIHTAVRMMMENAEVVRIYYSESHGFPDGLSDPGGEVSRLREAVLEKLTGIFESGVRRGLFREMPARLAAICLVGMVEHTVVQSLKDTAVGAAGDVAGCVEKVFFQGVLREKGRTRRGRGRTEAPR